MTTTGMTVSLGIVLITFGLWYVMRVGQKAGKVDQLEETLEAIDEANEIRNDVRDEPDPQQRLRDDWSR